MGAEKLDVEHFDTVRGERAAERDEDDLRRAVDETEHRFAAEHAVKTDTVKPATQDPRLPEFTAVGAALGKKFAIGADQGRCDPAATVPSRAQVDHRVEGAVIAQGIVFFAHLAAQGTADMDPLGADERPWIGGPP